jgi:hypothetical protein
MVLVISLLYVDALRKVKNIVYLYLNLFRVSKTQGLPAARYSLLDFLRK